MGVADWIDIGRMDELGRMDTPVHRIDARAKALVTIAFIVVVMSFPRHEISALTPFLFYPLLLLVLGRIPLRPVLMKMLVASPFALAIGILNPLLDRQPVMSLGSLAVSGGWLSFGSIMFRFVLTVGAALTLIACTGLYRLCAGLEQLGVPRVFVVQLLFLYRYLFVMAVEARTMLRSLALRSGGRRSPHLRVYGALVGHLLLRSMDRGGRIYRAMVARGFDGNVRVWRRSVFRWQDWAFLFGGMAFLLTARTWNIAHGFGAWITGSVQ